MKVWGHGVKDEGTDKGWGVKICLLRELVVKKHKIKCKFYLL